MKELEDTLTRELREVSDGLQVPPMPAGLIANEAPLQTARRWRAGLVAAAVVLILGVTTLVLHERQDSDIQPAPPAPTPTAPANTDPSPRPESIASIPTTDPAVASIVDQRLYVDGHQVPGAWWSVESRGDVWLAVQSDGSWWWGGPGVDTSKIDAQIDQPPVISPNGRYIAFLDLSGGKVVLTGFTTEPAGEGFGQAPVDLPRAEGGVALAVRAVTDDGDVIVQGARTAVMWRAVQDQGTVVDLSQTAPDRVFLQGTSAGLVVVDGKPGYVDGANATPYLATVSSDGRLTTKGTLPTYDALEIGPGGTWLVRSPAGTLGGEVTSVVSLEAQAVGSSNVVVLDSPKGWGFASGSWAWEDDATFVAVLVRDSAREAFNVRLVRCSVTIGACRPFAAPVGDAERGGFSVEETLGNVVEAVVAGDRALLADPSVIGDTEWEQLVGFAAGKGGSPGTCRDNGSGTKDCAIEFAASRRTVYYAILEPAKNDYGWRLTYVGIGGA